MKKIYFTFTLILFFFYARAQQAPFVTTWEVTGNYLNIAIPTYNNEVYNYNIDFGDGTLHSNLTGNISHVYNQPGVYTVSITGTFPKPRFGGSPKLMSVEQWGDIQWQSMENAFENCNNLVINATDAPDLSQVSSLHGMFHNTNSLNQSINHWNVSSITNMSSMFSGSSYNQPLDNWDVSNVTNMQNMFNNSLFNQPINTWNVSSVTTMGGMFRFTDFFNQPLSNWDVSNVTDMANMFWDAVYDQPLNNWNVSNVTNMSHMFYSCFFDHPLDNWDVSNVTNMWGMFIDSPFNHPINNWNVSNVTNMSGMFNAAYLFDQPLDNWDVSNVTDMSGMFGGYSTSFNQPLNSWDVSNVTNMAGMFDGSRLFNQPLNHWNVSNVTSMRGMFTDTDLFNQPLNNWDVSNVNNMWQMFQNAISYNQPLDNWDVSNVITMTEMFKGAEDFNQNLSSWNYNPNVQFEMNFLNSGFIPNSGMDVHNYEALLTRFVALGLENKEFKVTGMEYCNEADRNELINNLGWLIYEDDLADECNFIVGNIYFDENDNGCDQTDVPVSGARIRGNSIFHTSQTFSNDGSYSIGYLGSNLTVAVTNLPDYFSASPASSTITFPPEDNEIQLNFCLTANQSVEDLNIVLLPLTEARPGFEAEYQLVVSNVGTETINNITASLNFDETTQSFVNATPAPSSSTISTLSFSIASLQPFQTQTLDLTMLTFEPPTVNGDDILNFTATASPNSNDNTPQDNTYALDQMVVNSYDPNDKRVLQGEEIYMEQTDEYLDYIIRFQNTGTASAINVRLLDTLHPKLNWNTMQPISASHDYQIRITNGNKVEFIFDNINLPYEADNEPESHGFVAYRIKLNDDVQIGDIVSGDAEIYFDFNAPIITNNATTEIVQNMGINDNDYLAKKLTLYPNPTKDNFNVKAIGGILIEEIILYNLQGIEVRRVAEPNQNIDISKLASGMYFVKIITNQGNANRQLIKN